jgi:4-diphosphocytidyl-2-C-methyl-D-erythritol kinase
MINFPNCKINLGLQVLGKRADGFHNLSTIFYPIPLYDVLEIIPLDKSKNHSFSVPDVVYTASGLQVFGEVANNLCIKAYQLLKKDFPELPPVQMHLHKAIPMGAGLGGGSADGAFCLRLLNDQFRLGISSDRLIEYALVLGSDCPFFIVNQACVASGRGEVLKPIDLNLTAYAFLLINPNIHVNTGWAFEQLANAENKMSHADLETVKAAPIATWKENLKNDFESAVMQAHPAIASIKEKLYDAGATYASMTGTGSTVYGIFEKQMKPKLSFANDYWVKWI